MNHKTGKDIHFKIPTSITPKSVRLLSKTLMVDSFIHEQNEYSMEETEPLRFSVFVLERVQRMPEHDALLSELRIEIAVLDAELRSPEALIEFNKSMADRFRKMGLDFLAEAAEDLAQASISKRKKTIS